jgi:DNA-binding transcriptional regulator YiaG
MPDLPGALKAWRAAAGLTQAAAAAVLAVPLRTYQEWEQGRREPDHPSLLLLAIGRVWDARAVVSG